MKVAKERELSSLQSLPHGLKEFLREEARNNSLKDIIWRVEDYQDHELLFYHLPLKPKKEDFERAKERLNQSPIQAVVFNQKVPENFFSQKTLSLSDEDFKESQRLICDALYPLPQQLKLVGITGTNGKTTVVELARQIAEQQGQRSIGLGTLGLIEKDELICQTNLTTPSFIDLRKIFFRYGQKVEFCFFEVSSHALLQERLYRIPLDLALWTNFTQDHLDYHKTMKSYFEAKTLIFSHLKSNTPCFIPRNEKSLGEKLEAQGLPFAMTKKRERPLGPFFQVEHNQDNYELATQACEYFLGDLDLSSTLNPPRGRFELFQHGGKSWIIDYAHTPDALMRLLKGVRESFPKRRVLIVFGCGGDRDQGKRKPMAQAVSSLADVVLVTSDNPRFEDPSQIVQDVLSYIQLEESRSKGQDVFGITDREEAINQAFMCAGPNDIIVVAGKGHEDYQEIQGVKYPFDDKKVILSLKS